MSNINHAAILSFFTGKGREAAAEALQLLAASEAQGFWVPGASRRVASVFGKANLAIKQGKKIDAAVDAISYGYGEDNAADQLAFKQCMQGISMNLLFSSFRAAQTLVVHPRAETEFPEAVAAHRAFAEAFAGAAALVDKLDATRPKPVFTNMNASPTVSATVASYGAVSVDVCPIEYEQVEFVGENGKKAYSWVVRLVWPAGTQHGTSKHRRGNGSKCEACGHKISNSCNWVPLILNGADGVPRSLWTGRDCAKTIFEIDMKGDLEIKD